MRAIAPTLLAAAALAAGAAPALASPTSPAAAPPLAGRVVAIDPGHDGGNSAHAATVARLVWAGNRWKACDTSGTETRGGLTESAYTLDVARRLALRLRELGARVVLTRRTDRGVGPCITERAAIGNRARADVAISIHADGNDAAGARGFHVIRPLRVPGLNDRMVAPSARLAALVRDAFRRGTPMPYSNYAGVRGVVARDDLGGLNLSRVPKVLIETGNMREARDARLLASSAFRARAARALARGIARYLVGT